MIALAAGFIVVIAFVEKTSALAIIGYILCGAVILISLFVLVTNVFDFVKVKDGYIIKQTLFVKKKAKISRISKIKKDQNFYVIYINGAKFVSLNDRDPETAKMLFQFEREGINIGKIE